jgi:hypothetical protein
MLATQSKHESEAAVAAFDLLKDAHGLRKILFRYDGICSNRLEPDTIVKYDHNLLRMLYILDLKKSDKSWTLNLLKFAAYRPHCRQCPRGTSKMLRS